MKLKLTPIEENIFISGLRAGERPLFNLGGYLKLQGAFTAREIEESLWRLIRSNLAFFIRLQSVPGELLPVKICDSEPVCQIDYVDFSHSGDSLNLCDQFLERMIAQPISLFSRIYYYFYIIRIRDDQFTIAVVGHHLFADGISLQLFMNNAIRELIGSDKINASIGTNYESIFLDEIRRYSSYINSKLYWKDKDYWLARFSIRNLTPYQSSDEPLLFSAKRIKYRVPARQSQRLRLASRTFGVSFDNIVVALILVAFYRVYSSATINFGLFLHNRTRHCLKDAVGLFSSVIPCVTELSSGASISEVIASVSKIIRQSYRHRKFPISDLNRELINEFGGIINYDFVIGVEMMQCLLPGQDADITVGELYPDLMEFPIAIRYRVFQGLDTDEIDIAYDENTITSAEVKVLVDYFKRLTTYHDFDHTLGSSFLLPVESIARLSSPTIKKSRFARLIHQQFEWTVDKYPSRIAVICAGEVITYSELEMRANRVANYLVNNGVVPENVVGICCNRSGDALTAVLGVLKTGACYLPLDPSYPPERLQYMIDDSEVVWVIGHSNTRLSFLDSASISLLFLDNESDLKGLSVTSDRRLSLDLPETNLAYLIYTSGSTGRPKGVMVEHKSVINFLTSMSESPGISIDDVILSITSLSFDIHVLEIFLPLSVGSVVIIASGQEYHSAKEIIRLVSSYDVTIIQATPSTWNLLLDEEWYPGSRIKALCGGEKLDEATLHKFQKRETIELWNMYGPTETTVWSFIEKIEKEIFLGRPISRTQYLILNENKQEVPMEVPGELYIGGAGLARGYWRRPDLTTSKFVDIDGPYLHSRFYATGDIVKQDANGNISYQGRKDFQIKLQGVRIEAEEIESVILLCPEVASAVVVLRDAGVEKSILVAFVVLKDKHDSFFVLQKVKSFLAARVPHHMLPRKIVRLASVPLTLNGKVNRKALLNVDIDTVVVASPTTCLETDNERILAEIWSSVLNIPFCEIYRETNLLDLGADSFSIMMIWVRCRDYGLKCALEDLFSGASLASISEVVNISSSRMNKEPMHTQVECAMLADQKGVLGERYGNQPFCMNSIFDLHGEISRAHLQDALQKVVRKHTSLQLKFYREHSQWKCSPGNFALKEGALDFQRIERTWDDSSKPHLRIFNEMYPYLIPEEGAHLAVRVVADKNEVRKLFFSISHLVCDQYSLEIIFSDFISLYRNEMNEQSLNHRNDQYPFIANSIHSLVNSSEYYDQIFFWESLPWDKLVPLPIDSSGSNNKLKNIAATSRIQFTTLDVEETDLMVSVCKDYLNTSVLHFLVAALVSFFKSLNGSDCQYLFVYGHGRDHFDDNRLKEKIAGLVGFFATFKAYFLQVKHDHLGIQYYKDIEDQIGKIPFSGRGFQQLRNNCDNEEILKRMRAFPGPDVWLNYVGVRQKSSTDVGEWLSPSPLMYSSEYVHISPSFPRARMLTLPWDISDGQLRMFWEYSSAIHRDETIKEFSSGFRLHLLKIIYALSSTPAALQ